MHFLMPKQSNELQKQILMQHMQHTKQTMMTRPATEQAMTRAASQYLPKGKVSFCKEKKMYK